VVARGGKGAGRLLEQIFDHRSDRDVVIGGEMARLPVEIWSDSDRDFSAFLHGLGVACERKFSPSISKCAPKRGNYLQTAATGGGGWRHRPRKEQ